MRYHSIMTKYHETMANWHGGQGNLAKAKKHVSNAAYHALRDGRFGKFNILDERSAMFTERIKEARHDRLAMQGKHMVDDYELARAAR